MSRRHGWHVGLLLTCALLLLPVGLAVLASFKKPGDIFSADPLPLHPTLANYHVAFTQFPIIRLLANTIITSLGVMTLQLAVAVLAGYALVRWHTRLGQLTLLAGTVAVVIPAQALLIPQFLMVAQLGWLNSYAALIVPQLAGCAVPLLLLRRYLAELPPSITEAAQLDGAGSWRTLWHVLLPLLRPGLVAVGILVFVNTGNEYLWPLLATPDVTHSTIQVGLAQFGNTEGANPGPLLAAATVATTPALIGYALAARRVTDAFIRAGIH